MPRQQKRVPSIQALSEDILPFYGRDKRIYKNDISGLKKYNPLFETPTTVNKTYEDLINNANINYLIQKNMF